MCHMQVAGSNGRRMAEHHVERSNRSRRRLIDDAVWSAFEKQRHYRFQIGTADQRESVVSENAPEFGQRVRNFMGVEMFQAVRGPDRVESLCLEMPAHVRHRADEIRLDPRVEIDADLLPCCRIEYRIEFADRSWSRAAVQYLFASGACEATGLSGGFYTRIGFSNADKIRRMRINLNGSPLTICHRQSEEVVRNARLNLERMHSQLKIVSKIPTFGDER